MATRTTQYVEVRYPESDGKPMGETGIHAECTLELYGTLLYHFRPRGDVYVGNNLFVYYEEGDPTKVVCPDVFVALAVPGEQRRTWKVWEEDKGPDVVFEISSENTRLEDLGNKRVLYAELGVAEYYLFDPLREWLEAPLRGYKLVAGEYELMGEPSFKSELLGLEIHGKERRVRLFNPETGRFLPAPWDEPDARAEVEAELREAKKARTRAENRLAKAQAEIERLRAQLKWRKKS